MSVAGIDVAQNPMAARRHIGFFPSADRTFYNRLSGLENLAFFGRMYGIGRQEALARARKRLVDVGLSDAVEQRVGSYSHGMQKRLSMARALLMDPPVLVIDEATDGLDPEGARRVQDLTRSIAADGTAVIWTTQRLDEIRGFADAVTVLDQGRTTFQGTVEDLMLKSSARGYLLRLRTADATLDDDAWDGPRGAGRSRNAGAGGHRSRTLPARPRRARRAGRGAGRYLGHRCRRARLRPAALRAGGVVPAADDGQDVTGGDRACWPRRSSSGRSFDATCWCG